ncbi:MAG: HIT family protein [Anaerolineales bacterium]|uniref:HIT family protein n=1 Tax=Candidatus Desulfolinea nitratireducens TaxID=2841698 RepID=A0A8J6THF5_9CHLR|nr:HIT family protein [Candidatus Desulfolinea nitratireducens]
MTCVFCEVSVRKVPASYVYNDRDVFAIMSLEQPNPYKVLVIPHAHVESIYDLEDELAASIFQVTAKIARAIRKVSNCDGMNLVQSNGRAGQQDVFHFHLHLVPRFAGDQIIFDWDNTPSKRETLDQFADEICLGLKK